MGDLCLTQEQVNPVRSVALDGGLEVTALHNDFFWDSPRVMFMHIGGMGDEKALASAVGKVFAKIKETTGEQPRIVFLHCWGTGAAQDLARGLRTALDRTATRLGAR